MRTRSLFWTFAGVFLLVLAAATVFQVVVSMAVLRPLQAQGVRDRAEQAIAGASQELAALSDIYDDQSVTRALAAHRLEGEAVLLAFRASDGHITLERRAEPALQRQIESLLAGSMSARAIVLSAYQGADRTDKRVGMRSPPRSGAEPPPPPPGDNRAPRAGPPPRPGEPGAPGARPSPPPRRDGPPPQDEPRPPREDQAPPPRDGASRAPLDRPTPARADGPRDLHVELLVRRPVVSGTLSLGDVVAIRTTTDSRPWSLPEARSLLLFLPFAVLASGGAGLFMVRMLVRRLRVLELLAARVTEGDLGARVVDSRSDEIGRLGERFNRMTERLATARAQLEDNDQQRRRLLADITHELATPLTSIRGYVETLLDPAVPTTPEERAAYLKDVLEEANRLDLLTGDLFDFVRLESGATPLSVQRLDWMALCRNTTRRFEPRFREAGLGLEWKGAPDDAWIRADGRRMEQVVENLLVNALKYVPAGGTVEVSLERIASPTGDRFRLALGDDGPGIAPEDLPRIFDRFYRADAVRSSSGSGLGLAIVQEIVRKHGGEVRAEARVPRGMKFIIEVPAPSA